MSLGRKGTVVSALLTFVVSFGLARFVLNGPEADGARMPAESSAGQGLPTGGPSDKIFAVRWLQQADLEFLSAETDVVEDEALVIGVSVAGEHRAYAVQSLTFPVFSVINDLLGTTPVTVTYEDATDTARVLTTEDRSDALDVICYGIVDGKFILKLDGRAYAQESVDMPLTDIQFSRTTWARWKASHPTTTVFAGIQSRGAVLRDMVVRLRGLRTPPAVPAESATLADSTDVIGVTAGGRSRAYVQAAMVNPASHVINDLLGESAVTVTYCNITDCVRVFTEPMRTDPLHVAVHGLVGGTMFLELDGEKYQQDAAEFLLPELEFTRTSWSNWKREHPDTDVYIGGLIPGAD